MFGSLQPGSTDYIRGGRRTVWRWSGGVARSSGWLQPANRVCELNVELSSAELFVCVCMVVSLRFNKTTSRCSMSWAQETSAPW